MPADNPKVGETWRHLYCKPSCPPRIITHVGVFSGSLQPSVYYKSCSCGKLFGGMFGLNAFLKSGQWGFIADASLPLQDLDLLADKVVLPTSNPRTIQFVKQEKLASKSLCITCSTAYVTEPLFIPCNSCKVNAC